MLGNDDTAREYSLFFWIVLGSMHNSFYVQFLHGMVLIFILTAMLWIIAAGLIFNGTTTSAGYFHWVSDGFDNHTVLSLLILGTTSHFVFALRAFAAYKFLQGAAFKQNLAATLLPFVIGCGMISLRFDVVKGAAHGLASSVTIIFSITFFYFIKDKMGRWFELLWASCVAGCLLIILLIAYAATRNPDLWMAAGIAEYVLIELIFAMDLVLLFKLSSNPVPPKETYVEPKKEEPLQAEPRASSLFKLQGNVPLAALRVRM